MSLSGLGFAIPVDLAMSIADEIIATGTVTHAFFGVQTVPIPPAAAAQAGVPESGLSILTWSKRVAFGAHRSPLRTDRPGIGRSRDSLISIG